jgi:hypothetical protein
MSGDLRIHFNDRRQQHDARRSQRLDEVGLLGGAEGGFVHATDRGIVGDGFRTDEWREAHGTTSMSEAPRPPCDTHLPTRRARAGLPALSASSYATRGRVSVDESLLGGSRIRSLAPPSTRHATY